MLRLRLGSLLGLLGAAILPSASCASKFSNAEGPSASAGVGQGGSVPSAGRSGVGAGQGGTGAHAGSGARAGSNASGGRMSGSGGKHQGGASASAGTVSTGSGGVSTTAGTGDNGGGSATGGSDVTGGEGGDMNGGSGGSSGGPPVDPISHDGLVYWFSADFGVTEMNGGVSKWLDRSGNAADAVQMSANGRPTLGKFGDGDAPALVFDGDNDYLGLPPLVTTFEAGVAFFAVARPLGGSYCMPMLELSNGEEIDDINFGWLNASLSYEVYNDTLFGQNGAFDNGESRLVEVTHAPTGDVGMWMNGLSNGLDSFDLPTSITRNQTFVGRSLYHACTTWNGEIAELILYARALEDTERQDVEHYLQDKWGCCSN